MAKLKILTAGDPVLRKTAEEVKRIDKKLTKLLKDMAETMYAADGVGLAAPQIGVSKRIVSEEGSVVGGEGCLSVPEYEGEVERAEKVECEFTDRTGKRYLMEATGLMAIAIQHELDHLDGVLFIDKAQTIMPKQKEKLDK